MNIRNIKFKAKRLDNGEWVKGDLAHSLDGGLNILGFTRENGVDGYSGVHLINPQTVCQFTGMKDCEGKEVWEGDILEGSHKGEICFYQGAFVIHSTDDNTFSSLFNYITWDGKITCKVVGNKFDNEK